MESNIRTQRFGLGDLLGRGWELYRTSFKQILPIILCVYIPYNIIAVASNQDALLNFTWSLLGLLLVPITTIAIAYVVDNKLQGQSVAWDKAIAFGLSRWLSAFFTGSLAGLIILGLTLLLIVPGIIWSVYYVFWPYVVALRDLDTTYALGYSKDLVKGQWWKVFGYFLAISILQLVVEAVIAVPYALLPTNPALDIVAITIDQIVRALFTVITVVFFLNTDYLKHLSEIAPNDEKVRKCENCGAIIRPGAVFCSSCGGKLVGTVGAS